MVFDNLKYEKVSNLARRINLEWINFNLFNIGYALRTCPSKNDDGSPNGIPAEYHKQIDTDLWAIYIWEEIGEKIQRILLFHEVVEIYHKYALDMEKTDAHNATIPLERKFCEEYLTSSELKDYLKFKNEWGYNGFGLSKGIG